MNFGDIRGSLDAIIKYLKSIDRNTDDNACCVAITSAGVNTNVPSGFGSISIALLSGSISVTMSDGSIYPMSTVGEVLVQAAAPNAALPTYVISGTGTWKWSGVK